MGSSNVDVIMTGNLYISNGSAIDTCFVKGSKHNVTEKFYNSHRTLMKIPKKKKEKAVKKETAQNKAVTSGQNKKGGEG